MKRQKLRKNAAPNLKKRENAAVNAQLLLLYRKRLKRPPDRVTAPAFGIAFNAFTKVRESFPIFVADLTTITEIRLIHIRLKEVERNIELEIE